MHRCNKTHLYINDPAERSGDAEGSPSGWILHIAQEQEIKEEPANDFNQLLVSLSLAITHRVPRRQEGEVEEYSTVLDDQRQRPQFVDGIEWCECLIDTNSTVFRALLQL